MGANLFGGESLDVRRDAPTILPQGAGIVARLQLDQHLLSRFVFQILQILQGEHLHRFDFVFRQVGAQKNVCVDLERSRDVARHRRGPKARVHRTDTFVAVEPQVVERQRQIAAVAVAGAARDHIRKHRGNAQAAGWIVDTACGNHEVGSCRRAHVIHAFGQQGQAVGKSVLMDRLGHVFVTFGNESNSRATRCSLRACKWSSSGENRAAYRVEPQRRSAQSLPGSQRPNQPGEIRSALAGAAQCPARGPDILPKLPSSERRPSPGGRSTLARSRNIHPGRQSARWRREQKYPSAQSPA